MSRSTAALTPALTPALTIGAVLAATATAVIWWTRADAGQTLPHAGGDGGSGGASSTAPADAGTGAAIAPATGGVAPTTIESPSIAIDPALPANRTWLLPDGTRVMALNGAHDARPLGEAWPRDVPWSPIVRVERSDLGVDWYVHEDGSRSTTEMKWRSDLGREDAVTRLARPAPQVPQVQAAGK